MRDSRHGSIVWLNDARVGAGRDGLRVFQPTLAVALGRSRASRDTRLAAVRSWVAHGRAGIPGSLPFAPSIRRWRASPRISPNSRYRPPSGSRLPRGTTSDAAAGTTSRAERTSTAGPVDVSVRTCCAMCRAPGCPPRCSAPKSRRRFSWRPPRCTGSSATRVSLPPHGRRRRRAPCTSCRWRPLRHSKRSRPRRRVRHAGRRCTC